MIDVVEGDRRMFETGYRREYVHVIDTAADVDYFQWIDEREVANRIMSVGSMDWPPNEDGLIDIPPWNDAHEQP